jgi:hypothetical protein
VVTGPPPGLVSIGGYRFALDDLQDVVARADGGATIAALPDPLVGQRLVGSATDRDNMLVALDLAGVNPLILGAFRGRTGVAA